MDTITDPSKYRDRTRDWFDFFHSRRRQIIAQMITPEVIEEHKRDPRGTGGAHSRELGEVLRYIRNIPSDGKTFIYAMKPFHEYRLARMAGAGGTTQLIGNEIFKTEGDAAHAVFMSRLAELGLWNSPISESGLS
jgi:branched-chain amino acid transport system permease protein